MIQWVYEAAVASGITNTILVATPDPEIVDACKAFGAEAILTRLDHPSGTDRIAEVAEKVPVDLYVNVQGDEPLMKPESIRECALPLLQDSNIQMGSIYSYAHGDEIHNPAVVKVVMDLNGYALYFSRHTIPYERNRGTDLPRKHIGIYAYRRETLMTFSKWEPTYLEVTEGLEQLRFLEHGVKILMSKGFESEMAVDTPEQADHVRGVLTRRAERAAEA